jgi:hypothetical protein
MRDFFLMATGYFAAIVAFDGFISCARGRIGCEGRDIAPVMSILEPLRGAYLRPTIADCRL